MRDAKAVIFRASKRASIQPYQHYRIRPFSHIPTCCCTTWSENLADGGPTFKPRAANGAHAYWGIGLIETVNGHTNYLHDLVAPAT